MYTALFLSMENIFRIFIIIIVIGVGEHPTPVVFSEA